MTTPTLAEMSPFSKDWPCAEAIFGLASYSEEYKCKLIVRMLAASWPQNNEAVAWASNGALESTVNEFQAFMKVARKLCGMPETEFTAEEALVFGEDEDEDEEEETAA